MSLTKKLGNIVWHIENNRGIIGDTKVLDQVLESLKGLENELHVAPMTLESAKESGKQFSTGFMNGINLVQVSTPVQPSHTFKEGKPRFWYGKHRGHNKWDLAKDYFQMSNDAFFDHYGFNFVPTGRLYDEAKGFLARQENVFRGGTMNNGAY